MIRLNLIVLTVVSLLSTMGYVNAETNSLGKTENQAVSPEKHKEMMNRQLELIKAKNPQLYKELVALREKNPEQFRARMRELHKKQMSGSEGKEQALQGEHVTKALERIKEKDQAAYLELLDLRDKEPAQFRVKLAEYMQKYASPHEKGQGSKKKNK